MKIRTTGPLKHGRAAMKARTVYEVPDALAGFFVGTGWAEPAPAAAKAVTIDPKLFDPNPPAKAGAGETQIISPDDVVRSSSTK